MHEQYLALMRDFAKTLEMEHDFASPEEPFCLEFDGVACYFEPAPAGGGLLLYAFAGMLPAGREDAARRELLAGNCFFRATAGATLAAAPGSNRVILQRILPLAGLETPGLMDEVEKMAAAASVWAERLRNLPDGAEAGAAADAEATDGADRRGFIKV